MAESEQQQAPKKKFPLKTLLVLIAVFLLEGLIIAGAFFFAGGPKEVRATGGEEGDLTRAEQQVSVLVVEGKFINTKTGRTYVYETEIHILVKRKHERKAAQDIEAMQARLQHEVRTVIARAEPAHLAEDSLATITRQIQQQFEELLSRDNEGKTIIEGVLIPKWAKYRADM